MMKGKEELWSTASIFIIIAIIVHSQLLYSSLAQTTNQTQATTDPSEVSALNEVFNSWGISAAANSWNISGEPCTGVAIDSTTFDNGNYNPLIKCDCSYDNNSTCHITQLKVYALSVTGTIPDELWNLTYLFNLKLGQNVLTGSISPAIGNFTRMQYLDFGINSLSGELPKELGKLTNLLVFAFGANNFSGPLPSELGDLTKLEQLYFDGAGVSGPIPSTFSKLQNLVTVWASDNELTGPLPDFIGNWTKLNQLVLHGTSLDGPIPSKLSTLTSLTDLRISGMTNGTSSLDFIKDMKNLTTLILRYNNISDSIPSNIGEYSSLKQLDLSFNNLNGQIPDSLFNLSLLSFLFLGNNSLNGTLPTSKSSSLVNIDVSYNFLSGSFPSWINSQQNLQLNLVGNNFTVQNSNSSVLPSGLNCLQRNFPCNRGDPIYSSFAVKCGGPQITSSTGIVYERDNINSSLGPATYYVTDALRWAVSNVGYFTDNNSPSYTSFSSSQFTNTLDSKIYQTSRLSASSLRYYGLGLENGNYTVTLQFAESAILNSQWQSVGRRIFDIYIQGNITIKDFDIREAGGGSFRALTRNFTAEVTENYLEIHLFWAGKGTCCVPAQATYGPVISAISTTPNFIPTVSNIPTYGPEVTTGMVVGVSVGVAVGVAIACLLAVSLVFFLVWRRKSRRAYEENDLLGIDIKPYTFSYSELKAATDEFSPVNKLGEGGFGPVFRGTLGDGRVIAVKQLSLTSNQGKSQFVTEIATISAVQHRNLVKLYGCCIEGDKRLLVYEFLENKSLDQALFGQRCLNLDWPTRYEICLGVARGLSYLHEDSRMRIVHRDVKASNILLDASLTPKISDFGLAKLYDDKKTHISTRVAGTIGYLAPEYAMRGHLTEKADVFAYGVVALEVLSGRSNSDHSLGRDKVFLLELAWNLHELNQENELVDPRLSDFNKEEAQRLVGVALLCTQTSPMMRPSMSRVIAMLSGDIEVRSATTRPGYLTDWKDIDESFIIETSSASVETKKHDYDSSPLTSSTIGREDLSPANATQPMLSQIIGQGR